LFCWLRTAADWRQWQVQVRGKELPW